jgi:squalene synthase HpnC
MTESPSVTLPRPESFSAQAAAENFPVASRLLPKELRRHLMAVYGFARLVDDLGDELAGSPQERLSALDAAEGELDRCFGGDSPPTHPVFVRLAATVKERSLPRQAFADLLEANRVDQRVFHYETFQDLVGYCRLSANPVGRLVLAIFGQDTPEQLSLSDDICTALQIIEHVQDIAEDASRGRCYLPAEDRRNFGVSTGPSGELIVKKPITPALTRLLAFETSRANSLLIRGAPLVASLTGWAKMAVAGYLGGGLAQIEALRRSGYDVISQRAKASGTSIFFKSASALVRTARLR